MRLHVIGHVPFEGPGAIEQWATERGFDITRSQALTEVFPPLSEVDFLVIMGGPMDADDAEASPWLVAEKRYVGEAMAAGRLVLGVCLGSQIVAEVGGGRVKRNPQLEIGYFPVQHTEVTANDPVFSAFPDGLVVGHWHGDTFDVPAGARPALSSDACVNQAFSIMGGRVVGLQCHLEWSPDDVAELVHHCGAELIAPRPHVQSAEMLLAEAEANAAACHEALFGLLDRMVGRYGGRGA